MTSRYVIIGAGAVGGVIGGRLAGSGHEVVLVARGAHFEALREHGPLLRVPEGELPHRLPVVDGPGALGELRPDDVLVLAVKTQDSVAALRTWGPAPVAAVAVRRTRGRLRRRQPPHRHPAPPPPPHGTDGTARLVAADLEKSRFGAPVVADVARRQYAKLLSNLGNALEAVTGPVSDQDALALFRRVRAEGAAVLDAAGIAYASTEEQQAVRGDKVTLVPLDGALAAAAPPGSPSPAAPAPSRPTASTASSRASGGLDAGGGACATGRRGGRQHTLIN